MIWKLDNFVTSGGTVIWKLDIFVTSGGTNDLDPYNKQALSQHGSKNECRRIDSHRLLSLESFPGPGAA